MRRVRRLTAAPALAIGLLLALVLTPRDAATHCDTLDGPVVAAARSALEMSDVTPTLKWVKAEYEAELRKAFAHTLTVRTLSPEARELADTYFFETLVRLHRQGEGAPYTGLKPAGSVVAPAILAADEALVSGSVDALVDIVTADIAAAIRERFARALQLQRHADDSVEKGREYGAAYVEFIHYAERLHADASGSGGTEHSGTRE